MMYALVQNKLCVTLDYMKPPTERDPMLVNDGTVCGDHKVSDALMVAAPLGEEGPVESVAVVMASGPRGQWLFFSSIPKESGWMHGNPFRWVHHEA